MKPSLYAPAVLAVGLLCAQVIATVQVYLSNQALRELSTAVIGAGYLPVPNPRIMVQLDALPVAVAGGLFFTLSIGAGLSLATLIAAWSWDRLFRRRRAAVGGFLLLVAAGIVLVNANGWNPAASAYVVLVPWATWIAAVRLLPRRMPRAPRGAVVWPVSAALVLTLLWGQVLDRELFTNIRDFLLLGTRAGKTITDAYYTYTLFPAHAFSALEQRQIRTCRLDGNLNRTDWQRLERLVRRHDYLPLVDGGSANLTVGLDADGAHALLKHRQATVLAVPVQELFADTRGVLGRFSQRLDRNRAFRTLTLVCLLLGFPLVLYTLVYSLLALLPGLFFRAAVSHGVAAVLCVLIGIVLLVPVYRGATADIDPGGLTTALASSSEITRIVALRKAFAEGRDVTEAALENDLVNSTSVAQRYWLARCLTHAASRQAQSMRLTLLDDPTPIVACQAIWAIGRGNDPAMIPKLIDRLNTSSHWYVQMYAYRALRRLGWVQPRSPQHTF
jgi:hypothetical protein